MKKTRRRGENMRIIVDICAGIMAACVALPIILIAGLFGE